MPSKVYQAYNSRNKSWVKFKIKKGKFVPLDVKQKKSSKPFKGIKIKGKRK